MDAINVSETFQYFLEFNWLKPQIHLKKRNKDTYLYKLKSGFFIYYLHKTKKPLTHQWLFFDYKELHAKSIIMYFRVSRINSFNKYATFCAFNRFYYIFYTTHSRFVNSGDNKARFYICLRAKFTHI